MKNREIRYFGFGHLSLPSSHTIIVLVQDRPIRFGCSHQLGKQSCLRPVQGAPPGDATEHSGGSVGWSIEWCVCALAGPAMRFEMVGRLDECFLLSYGIDPEQAAGLLPAGLELITCRRAAFINIVICHVDRLRARFTPRALRATCWHIPYRIQVRATLAYDRPIEGLYFLRSDIDRPLFGVIRNRLTDFHFHAARVRFSNDDEAAWRLRLEPTAGGAPAPLPVLRAPGHLVAPRLPFLSLQERGRRRC